LQVNQKVLKRIIEPAGYDVALAADGKEALQAVNITQQDPENR
jgi:CheY-like chemotaxis protein